MIRELDPHSADELELVATRMRLTLVEVLGRDKAEALYTLEWLRNRVRWHLDPEACTGKVFLAELEGEVVGHTIVRLEEHEGERFGLFSTIYVAPDARRSGVAKALLLEGERWIEGQGMPEAATNTAEWNAGLIGLFESQGYRITERYPEPRMVRLAKAL